MKRNQLQCIYSNCSWIRCSNMKQLTKDSHWSYLYQYYNFQNRVTVESSATYSRNSRFIETFVICPQKKQQQQHQNKTTKMTKNSIFLLTQDVPTSEYLQKANSWDLRYSFLQCLDQYAENPTKNNHSEFQTQSENTLTIQARS